MDSLPHAWFHTSLHLNSLRPAVALKDPLRRLPTLMHESMSVQSVVEGLLALERHGHRRHACGHRRHHVLGLLPHRRLLSYRPQLRKEEARQHRQFRCKHPLCRSSTQVWGAGRGQEEAAFKTARMAAPLPIACFSPEIKCIRTPRASTNICCHRGDLKRASPDAYTCTSKHEPELLVRHQRQACAQMYDRI